MVIRWAGNCSVKSEQLFLGKFSVNVVTAAKGMEPEVVVCNGKEKKRGKTRVILVFGYKHFDYFNGFNGLNVEFKCGSSDQRCDQY